MREEELSGSPAGDVPYAAFDPTGTPLRAAERVS
jgi:hypothetical protein